MGLSPWRGRGRVRTVAATADLPFSLPLQRLREGGEPVPKSAKTPHTTSWQPPVAYSGAPLLSPIRWGREVNRGINR